jgi:hypothetical protein
VAAAKNVSTPDFDRWKFILSDLNPKMPGMLKAL